MIQEQIVIVTDGRGIYEITQRIASAVNEGGVTIGLCHVFCRHTSASLVLCENADPSVLKDVETFFGRLVPDGDPCFIHDAEGPDDMPAHIRTILTQSSLSIPISAGRLALGTWQGIFLYEHRSGPHRRQLVVTVSG